VNGFAPYLHRRLLRRSRWRVAILGALVVMVVLAALSSGAYIVARNAMYARLYWRLERAADRIEGPSAALTYLVIDERGHPLLESSSPSTLNSGAQGFRIVSDPELGPLAILRLRSSTGGLRVVATPAQEQLRAIAEFLKILIALTVAGGILALPVGYALAGLALQPLDEAVRERTEFVALASHQLRTPLSVIRTSAELAQAGRGLSPDEALATILQQTQRMEKLAARLTALTRAEAGSKTRQAQVDLARVATTVLEELTPVAAQMGVTMHAEVTDSVWVSAESDEMNDVLTTIVENAIQFSPRGGKIVLCIRAYGTQATAEVRDEGQGISPNDLPYVMNPFFQGQEPRGGFGLGLAIARAAVERRGGQLSITSALGRGTTVRVTLPRRPPRPASLGPSGPGH
jgi:signal transduction histidine kinase